MKSLLIEPLELAKLPAESCVVFDCRFSLVDHLAGKNAYDAGHIPNAYFLDMENDLTGEKHASRGRHPLPDATNFEKKLQQCGVRKDTTVVCYDDNRFAGASRLWWLLDYFGHQQIKVLNGGFNAWKNAKLPVATIPSDNSTLGNFTAQVDANKTTSMQQILSSIKSTHPIKLIDSREPPRYKGKEEPIDPVAGHIPGALNYPWFEVTNDDGTAKTIDFYRERWAPLASSDSITVYCGSGVTACVNLLSMRLAGIQIGKLYPGSWSQWCAKADNPIDRCII